MKQMLSRATTVLVLAAVGIATSAAEAAADTQMVFTADMSGDQVVDGPGDPDGSGWATITVNMQTEQVCIDVTTTNVDIPTEDYVIHEGAAGERSGHAWVQFNVYPYDPDPSTCLVDYYDFLTFKEIWKMIEDDPAGFHLDVHNYEYPDGGAIRGQLALESK